MDTEGRLLAGPLVICDFDHDPPRELLAAFTRAMAAAPSDDGLLGFEAMGAALGERLDVMGFDADAALAELEGSLELARSAYARLRLDASPADLLSDPWSGLAGLDGEGWLRRVGADAAQPDGVWSRWALGLIRERDPLTILRLTTLARPDTLFRLEVPPELPRSSDVPQRLLVVTQTAGDAAALEGVIAGRRPHLTDLVKVAHLGGDDTPEALRDQVMGLAALELKQPLVALFHPGSGDVCASLTLPDRVRALVVERAPMIDPPAALDTLLTVSRVGARSASRRRAARAGAASAAPAAARPASD